ncbi:hypothetical protein EVAR_67220_1 [Eumeta japonica]|uniref:Uncharacterized protein n=1 Tax=Eumeta variegata TaxID=151549 RepID=A0A4C2A5Y2_EUMVA|nr:hypothetical protein EVAR_67220_1 [Eumeta japonica]
MNLVSYNYDILNRTSPACEAKISDMDSTAPTRPRPRSDCRGNSSRFKSHRVYLQTATCAGVCALKGIGVRSAEAVGGRPPGPGVAEPRR